MAPDREASVDAKIARVDQHLSDFEKEVNRRLDGIESGQSYILRTLVGFLGMILVGVVVYAITSGIHP